MLLNYHFMLIYINKYAIMYYVFLKWGGVGMISFKKWQINDYSGYKRIMDEYGVSSLAAKVVASRLFKMHENDIFEADYTLHSPFELKDICEAADKINLAVDEGKKILVYGDYDADGVCATAILYSYLEVMGADVSYYIPTRDEGYGLNYDVIDEFNKKGIELIVTVDNGVSAIEEIDYAKSLGIDVVVTDHHMPQESLPDCIVVDPHRKDCPSKFKEICGAFVALKLVAALEGGEYEGAMEQYSEFVAIATLADVVPLIEENRTIVKLGINNLPRTDKIGLLELINSCYSDETKLDATAVSFGIVPRINAAGRMGSADRAVKLLLTENEDEAKELSLEICRENENRKNIEADILEDIEREFVANPEILNNRIIVVSLKNCHHGVLGIVASRIVDKYGKPAIILSEEDGISSGSGRSVEGFDLFDALLSCKELFTKFGGHSLAAGVTLNSCKVNKLRREINEYAAKNFAFMPEKVLTADAEIAPSEISLSAVNELNIISPFGKDNSEPVFVIKSVTVTGVSSIGNGKHSRLSLSLENFNFSAVMFGTDSQTLSVFVSKKTDILVKLKVNSYQGLDSVSIQIVDIRPEKINDELFFKEKQLFNIALLGENLSLKQAKYLMPTMEEAKEIYKIIKSMPNYDKGTDALWWQLSGKINRAKLSVILEAFVENNLISVINGKISVLPVAEKKDLFNCDILRHISCYLD